MPLIDCKFFAESLGMCTTVTVILPQQTRRQIGMESAAADTRDQGFQGHPTLYLLHGLSDDHSIWLRRTSIERYVAALGIAVVMPEVHRSFYTDMAFGQRYFLYVSEELPRLMRSFFRLSDRREDTFVAGLSMGGYGALKLALTNPEDYAAAASLSGVTDIVWAAEHRLHIVPDYHLIFGDLDKLPGSKNDLHHLATTLKQRCDKRGIDLPRFSVCCGSRDDLLIASQNTRDQFAQLGIPCDYTEDEGYGHSWTYWDGVMPRVLKKLGLDKS